MIHLSTQSGMFQDRYSAAFQLEKERSSFLATLGWKTNGPRKTMEFTVCSFGSWNLSLKDSRGQQICRTLRRFRAKGNTNSKLRNKRQVCNLIKVEIPAFK